MTLLVPTSASPYHLMQPYNFYHQQDLTAAPNRELSHLPFRSAVTGRVSDNVVCYKPLRQCTRALQQPAGL